MMYSPLVERIIDHVYRRHSNHGVKSKTRTQLHTAPPPERLLCCAVAAPVATTTSSQYLW
uniref:Uncharacterized protein n=1 Tax=Glossina palpalis gambiensis TaxID=67801 RepID=A0A1B0AWG3_9MUSC